jgi:hypothetical protein
MIIFVCTGGERGGGYSGSFGGGGGSRGGGYGGGADRWGGGRWRGGVKGNSKRDDYEIEPVQSRGGSRSAGGMPVGSTGLTEDNVRTLTAGASRPLDDDAMSVASNATRASSDTTVSAFYGPHSNMRKEQRGIKFDDIEDAKVKGTVSLAIHFKGENGRVQVMDEISTWGGRIKEEPQFEGIAMGDAIAKGRDGDRRMEVELQGSKKRARELKKWLKSKGYFGVSRTRVIYTQDRQQQPVVVVEGQLASLNVEVGIVTLFCRNEEGEEVDVEGIGLCSQCGIVIDKNSTDSTCCSFSHRWWTNRKMYTPGRDGKCKECERTREDHRKMRRGKACVHDLCYHSDWAKGYDECCCNCAKDKGWSTSGYEEYGCGQCKNKLRLVKASDGIANLEDIAEELESVTLSPADSREPGASHSTSPSLPTAAK